MADQTPLEHKTSEYSVKHFSGEGNGLLTVRDIREGEAVVSEGPLLLTVASEALLEVCSYCLRRLPCKGAASQCRGATADVLDSTEAVKHQS
jgi:hypothetical protein